MERQEKGFIHTYLIWCFAQKKTEYISWDFYVLKIGHDLYIHGWYIIN